MGIHQRGGCGPRRQKYLGGRALWRQQLRRKERRAVLRFDASGKLVKAFGEGLILFPHGIYVDQDDNVWVTDGQGANGKGHQVIKFSPDGRVLMTLGKAGVAGDGPDTFNQPNDIVVAPNGDIFISDGHSPKTGNARVVKFTKDGKFIRQWGGHGSAPGQFEVPHALALDSQGRLFVADRANNRIQIFDQDGNSIAQWKQFGRPSGIFIDRNDVIYVADSESTDKPGMATIQAGSGASAWEAQKMGRLQLSFPTR